MVPNNAGRQPNAVLSGEVASLDAGQITQLLRNAAAEQPAKEAIYLAMKAQMKEIAEREMKAADHLSLEASHVVNQVYMELVGNADISWQDRGHFLAYACRAIRSFLVDNARQRRAKKRGGGHVAADLANVAEPATGSPTPDEQAELSEELLRLDDVLPTLERDHPDLAAVVYLHFFGGLSFARIGSLLGIDPGTASRRWLKARMILQRDMTDGSE